MTRSWHGLVEILSHASTRRAVRIAMAQEGLPLHDRVAVVAPLLFGSSAELTPDDRAASAGIATLAIQMRGLSETWLVRPGASRVIHGTDLHAIPGEPPRLLRGAGIVQAHRPETGDRLWGNIASLGWCHVVDHIYLFGLGYLDGPDQIAWAAAKWSPQWTGQDIDPQLPTLDLSSPLIRDHDEHQEFASSAARYLIVLGLLAEAENSPLQIDLDKQTRWRHVRLNPRKRRLPVDPATESIPALALDGRISEDRRVSGHLKRQRYGEGCSLIKWIYVERYTARRWFAKRWIVSQKEHPHAQ